MRPAIRPTVRADLDAVVALDAECFGAEAWSRASWVDEFDRVGLDRLVLVADEGAVVGFVVLRVPPAAEDPVDLTRIAVVPAGRRTGIGGQLTTAALAAVPGRSILLEVAEGNEYARRLYAAHGFVEISRRRGYYPGPQDALILSLEQKAD